jgi:flagellar biogenesis protein FliO
MSLKDKRIKVVERTLLSNDKSLILVELENIFYLLAMDKTGVHLIDKRSDLDSNTFTSKPSGEKPDFMEHLKNSIIKRDNKSNESE